MVKAGLVVKRQLLAILRENVGQAVVAQVQHT